MSRFSDVINNYNEYILKKDLEILRDELRNCYKLYNSLIYYYSKNISEYRVIEISQEIILTFNAKNIEGTELAIGYPFPIYVEKVADNFGVSIRLSYRGKRLRNAQKNFLAVRLGNIYDTDIKDTSYCKLDFRILSDSLLRKCKSLLYVDSNTFIGDSIIELSLLDTIKTKYEQIEQINVLSHHAKHISGYYHACGYAESQRINAFLDHSDLIIISDLLDCHISNTLLFFEKYMPRIPVFILSRNIIIYPEVSEINMIKTNQDDVLLINQGIHQYLLDILDPFVFDNSLSKNSDHICFNTSKNTIFINPFSSQKEKDLDLNFIKTIVKIIYDNTSYRVLISCGITSEYSNTFIREVKDYLRLNEYIDRVEFVKDTDLNNLSSIINQQRVLASITADTSVSHLLTRNKCLNFTVYKFGFWDNKSIQSIAGESPFGYCSFSNYQIPVIHFEHIDINKLCNSILELILYINNKKEIKSVEFGEDYFGNLITYNRLLDNINDIAVRDSLRIIYDVFAISNEYYLYENTGRIIKNVFDISPVKKIWELINNKEREDMNRHE